MHRAPRTTRTTKVSVENHYFDLDQCIRHIFASQQCSHAAHKSNACKLNPFCWRSVIDDFDRGIWTTPLNYECWLGPDPRKQLRENISNDDGHWGPCGLGNMGATCYLNVLVQMICQNIILRDAILNVDVRFDGPIELAEVVKSLQFAIGHILHGSARVYSLETFVELMGLDKSVQQDPHEFYKLFFDKIADFQSKLLQPGIRYHTTGQEATTVTCNVCHHESRKVTDFQDIEVSIEGGVKTIDECVERYYQEEPMQGENKYFCCHCNMLCDAKRSTTLVEPPTVLTVHLSRNVYDRTTFQKKKLTNEIVFTEELRLGEHIYVLVGVLYHKGCSGLGGHYVAEVFDWVSKEWWFCNDEEIEKVDDMTFFFEQCASAVENVCNSHTKGKVSAALSGKKSRAKSARSNGTKMTTSARKKEAYLLSYVKKKDLTMATKKPGLQLRDDIQESINIADSRLRLEMTNYDKNRQQLQLKIEKRKEIVHSLRGILQSCDDQQKYLVPTTWLQLWVSGLPPDRLKDLSDDHVVTSIAENNCCFWHDTENPGLFFDCGMSNYYKMCSKHLDKSGIKPSDLKRYKIVPSVAYTLIKSSLTEVCESCDLLAQSESICSECISDLSSYVAKVKTSATIAQTIARIVGYDETPDIDFDDSIYRFSKESLAMLKKEWVKSGKVLLKLQQEIDARFTNIEKLIPALTTEENNESRIAINRNLLCTHGLPCSGFKKKSVAISKRSWDDMKCQYAEFCDWKTVMNDIPECGTCTTENNKMIDARRATRSEREAELNYRELKELNSRKMIFPSIMNDLLPCSKIENHRKSKSMNAFSVHSGAKFYLISSAWLTMWRAYIDDDTAAVIEPFESQSLLCRHKGALVPLTFRSHFTLSTHSICKVSQDDLPESELLSEDQYLRLVELGRIKQTNCCPAICLTVACGNENKVIFSWEPKECISCIKESEKRFSARRRVYQNEAIMVFKLRPGESPTAVLERERNSRERRSRRNLVEIRASSTDSIGTLKMKIFEKVDTAAPISQRLYYGAEELDSDSKTLECFGIPFGATIYLCVDEQLSDDEDVYIESMAAFCEATCRKSPVRGSVDKEDGFSGTLLGLRARTYDSVVHDLSTEVEEIDRENDDSCSMSFIESSHQAGKDDAFSHRKRHKRGLTGQLSGDEITETRRIACLLNDFSSTPAAALENHTRVVGQRDRILDALMDAGISRDQGTLLIGMYSSTGQGSTNSIIDKCIRDHRKI